MKNRQIFSAFVILIFSQSLCFGEITNVTLHGFLSQGYLKSNHNNFYAETESGTFEFNEMGINFSSSVTPRLHLGMQFFARDFGDLGNDEVTVSWAYGDYRFRDYLGIRAGTIKLAYGLYNEIRDMDILRPNILYPGGVYNESWRDFLSAIKGMGIYGNFNMGFLGKIKYNAQYGNINIGLESSATELIENQASIVSAGATADVKAIDMHHVYSLKIFTESPFSMKGIKAGCSFLDLKYDNSIDISSAIFSGGIEVSIHSKMFISSIEFTKKNYSIASEYSIIELDFGLPLAIMPSYATNYKTQAYYFSFSYSLTDWLETYICYSKYNSNDSDKHGNMYTATDQKFLRWLDEIILSVRLDINDHWICKLETHFIDGATSLLDKDQGAPEILEDGTLKYPYKKEWVLFAAKLSYNF